MIKRVISQIKRRPHIYFSLLCLITVVCGYLLSFLMSSASGIQVIRAFFYISAAILGYFFIKFFVKLFMIKFRAAKSGSSIAIKAPEFKKLAEEMNVKLNKNRPFVLQKKLDNAYFDLLNKRVVFGDIFFNRLTSPERLATLSHEFTHEKNWHFLKTFALLAFIFILTALTMRREPDLIWFITWIALALAIFPHMNRKFEYEADAEAARRTSVEATISSLKKVRKEEQWDRESVTHPSINKRIQNILRNPKSKKPPPRPP